ncbi:HNH endonuclease [Actinospica robiniae]|uniref:HNH endonuclease n=1 Tax=Actinospica robiniae TaxID=304901 RepID=UPI00054E1D9E|nr:HNH endonuclease signature motif containing protein [Actinospica robiniae]
MTDIADALEVPDVAGLEQMAVVLRASVARQLEALAAAGPEDREAAAASLELAAAIGRIEQVAHGLHLQALAQADRVKAARGGIGPWLAARQGYATGHARALARDARLLACVPDLAPHLTAGELTADATRLLARTVKACKDTSIDPAEATSAILHLVKQDGVSAAAGHVRALEHRLDPDKAKSDHERHRQRSKAESWRLENGLWRFEILLDPARAAVVKAALEALTAHWMRVNGRDGIQILPEDVKTTEQITAHAFYHLAKVCLNAPPRLRQAAFTPPVIFTAPLPDTDTDAEPTTTSGPMHNPAAATAGTAATAVTQDPVAPPATVAAAANAAAGTHHHTPATATPATAVLPDPVSGTMGPTIAVMRDPASDTVLEERSGGARGGRIPDGCALSAYDDVIPLAALVRTPPTRLAPLRDSARPRDRARLHDPAWLEDHARHRILHHDRDHRPVLLDGQPIDQNPHARLASAAQRTALAVRDRTCTYAGCDRPFPWSLEAHHLTPYSEGGATTLTNLTSLCAEHHRTLHHPDPH